MKESNANLTVRVLEYCQTPRTLVFDDTLIKLLADIYIALYHEKNYSKKNELLQLLATIRYSSKLSSRLYGKIIDEIALSEYKQGNSDFAEYMYRTICPSTDDIEVNNNFAFILRKKDKGNKLTINEIFNLLTIGVKAKNPYSLINLALLYSINMDGICPKSTPEEQFLKNLNTSNNWDIADELFSFLPNNLNEADIKWEQLGESGDPEGYLVHFFLLKHHKIIKSALGSTNKIYSYCRSVYPNITEKL